MWYCVLHWVDVDAGVASFVLRCPVPAPLAAASSPVGAPLTPAEEAMHVDRLRSFFAQHRPDNVNKAEELFKKHGGAQIWAQLARKPEYQGKTAAFTQVGG